MVLAFTLIGLVETHAVFTTYPLLVAALSGPVLGEKVGWRRWTAIAIGFVGVLIILQPGAGVFSPVALVPLLAAFMFALYALLTRALRATTARPRPSSGRAPWARPR
jgi:drug/metabolite transporter (DMT)-like permease